MNNSSKKTKLIRLDAGLLKAIQLSVGGSIEDESDQIRAVLALGLESFSLRVPRSPEGGDGHALAAQLTSLKIAALAADFDGFVDRASSAITTEIMTDEAWAMKAMEGVMAVIDMRVRALAHPRLMLFSQARGLLGTNASQRLLSESPEVIALMCWRHGMTTDLRCLIGNTMVTGLREAIERNAPVKALRYIRKPIVNYVARPGSVEHRGMLQTWLSAALFHDCAPGLWCTTARRGRPVGRPASPTSMPTRDATAC